jgi:hypothetical protein
LILKNNESKRLVKEELLSRVKVSYVSAELLHFVPQAFYLKLTGTAANIRTPRQKKILARLTL